MKDKIMAYIKENRKAVIICCCALMILAIAFGIAVRMRWIDLGIDSLVKPESGPFASVTRGYMRLRTEKAKYDVGDSINIKINSAFYHSAEDAKKAEFITFTIVCDKNLELIPVSFLAEKQALDVDPDDPDGIYGKTMYDDFYALTITEFDPLDLVYGPSIVMRYALPFSADFELRVREEAPEEFTAMVKFYARAGYLLPNGLGQVSQKNEAFLYVYCKNGKLYLSGKSYEDAKRIAGVRENDAEDLYGVPLITAEE